MLSRIMGEKEFYRKKIVDAAFDLGLEELRKLYYWINSMRCKIFDQNMVNIKVSDSAYLLIQVTDRMVQDYRECEKMSDTEGGGKDCETCSLDMRKEYCSGSCELCIGLCEFEEVESVIKRRCENE